jgi:hypothetical protein
MALDAQTQELADQLDIRNLISRYCWAIDKNDRELFGKVFLPDATAHLGSPLLEGIDAIWARIRVALGPLDDSQHITGSHLIELNGDTATSRVYLFAQHIRRDAKKGPHYVVAAEYLDDLVRTNEGWRIKYRIINPIWTEGNRGVVAPDFDN